MLAYLDARIQEISGVTMNEWVEIRATLTAIEQDKFNCTKCLSKYESRSDGEQMLARVRDSMGCKTVKDQPMHKIGSELSFRTCIGNFVRPQVYALLNAHARYQQGVMPYSGGFMDQPAKLIEVFSVIDNHRAEQQAAERSKADKIARRPGVPRGK